MQRCPYIHEMKERLLNDQQRESVPLEPLGKTISQDNRQLAESQQVGSIIKTDKYHTSPAHQRTPLVPKDLGEDFHLDFDDDFPIETKRRKNAKTSLFIVTSLVYAIILIVVCIAYVISDVTTHRLPVLYYESFFTYLYGASIFFLLYVFCFLLQESSCCNGGTNKSKQSHKDNASKSKNTDLKDSKNDKDLIKSGKSTSYQESQVESEIAVGTKQVRKRKTTHSDPTHGSFFLRVGAIAFGLGAMIYIGLEFGSFFEIPFDSPCHHILIGVNPLLQMIFTFMQMYFIFMNARLNIHRFKVIARFGLMHVVATNLCIWIRTLVKESLLEITLYYQRQDLDLQDTSIAHSIRQHSLRNAGIVLRTQSGPNEDIEVLDGEDLLPVNAYKTDNVLSKLVRKTVDGISRSLGISANEADDMTSGSTSKPDITFTTNSNRLIYTTPNYNSQWQSTTMARKLKKFISSTTASTTVSTTSTTSVLPTKLPLHALHESLSSSSTAMYSRGEDFSPQSTSYQSTSLLKDTFSSSPLSLSTRMPSSTTNNLFNFFTNFSSSSPTSEISFSTTTSIPFSVSRHAESKDTFDLTTDLIKDSFKTYSGISHIESNGIVNEIHHESLDNIYPAALSSNVGMLNLTECGRVDIMGTIVYDSAPYLYPFIIEYSFIGAIVLYVMWKHIGRYQGRLSDDDLEHRLEVMLSRRAVALAQQSHSGRVDCVGSSKGLFFGLLLLVGSLICLILFFVLVRHQQFSLLAIYLADASHTVLMVFSILAIIIGFIRVKKLKFRCEEQTNLNDILLRISAFGLFVYSVFSVISGSLECLKKESHLLVTTTSAIAVLQVILQLLFIADVSRRRVHLPEHDRSKPGRQIVTFLLICNVAMFAIYTFEAQKVLANPVQMDFYGFVPWSIIQRITLPLCIFHRFHSAVTLGEIWKTTYKARLE